MANEWVKVELYGQDNDGCPRRYTVASGTAITKGTLMALTDARTAIAHSSVDQAIAGIAAMGKSATDLSTSISCWTDGVFEAVASSAVVIGSAVVASKTANQVWTNHVAASGAALIGYALEAADAGETINVRVKL